MKTILFSLAIAASPAMALSIDAPAAGSRLDKRSVLKGTCDEGSDVYLKGPGIDRNKRISCRESGIYLYKLKNAFKDMRDGVVTIEVKQGSQTLSRSFVKGKVTAPVPPTTPASCVLNGRTIADGASLTAYRESQAASCVSESRLCKDGSLSGTFLFLSCAVVTEPTPTPQAKIDTRPWKVTLPIDSAGGFSGNAVEVKNLEGYQRPPYFVRNADDSITFSAPVEGATTSGSKYPRSELREMNLDGTLASWTVEKGGSLRATVAVNEIPKKSDGSSGRVVIGQIHGPDDELCRLYYDSGKIYFYDDKAGSAQRETQFILKSSSGAMTDIPLNSKFDYSIVVTKTTMMVSVIHNGVAYSASESIGPFWPGKSLYYKAGMYVQVGTNGSGAGTIGTGKGTATFSAIELKH